MTSKQIEELATIAVKNSILLTDSLYQFISENDKEPSWDGKVYIYKDKKKRKTDLVGRVDVQIKGKSCTNIDQNVIKFPVSISDLENYLKDSGVVYFVVLISDNGEKNKIFYNSLTPVKIKGILSETTNKTKISLEFEAFPVDNRIKTNIFMDFYENTKRQISFVNEDLPSIFDLDKASDQIEIIQTENFHGDRKSYKSFLMDRLDKEVYLYKKTELMSLPLSDVGKIFALGENIDQVVKVNEKEYYSSFERIHTKDKTSVKIGGSTEIYVNNHTNTMTFKITPSSMLLERVYDYTFIINAFEKGSLSINNVTIDLSALKITLSKEQLQKMKEHLKYCEKIIELFRILSITDDLELSKLTSSEGIHLDTLIYAFVDGNAVKFREKQENGYLNIKIQQLYILVYLEEVQGKPCCYKFINLFDGIYVIGTSKKGVEEKEVYPALALLKQDYYEKLSNINFEAILKQYKGCAKHNQRIYQSANLTVLEMLKAYDECKKKKLIEFAIDIMEWLLEEVKEKHTENIFSINYFQSLIRVRELNQEEQKQLFEIIRNTETGDDIKFAANVLLKQYTSAKLYFDNLNDDIKEAIRQFPIYNLYRKLDEEN